MSDAELRRLYLELLKATVRNEIYRRPPSPSTAEKAATVLRWARLRWKYRGSDSPIARYSPRDLMTTIESNRPVAHTLVSRQAADNLQSCIEDALSSGVQGDLIETGVFRGGMGILMRGVLAAWGEKDRKVYCADSWEGLPQPNADPDDVIAHEVLQSIDHFAVSLESVQETFERYGLLDDQVVFLKGWFADTLPAAPIERLAVARLDGDYYESTVDALEVLYPKLEPGGWLIVDDYGLPIGAKRAVDEYRERHGIDSQIRMADTQVAYWQKT